GLVEVALFALGRNSRLFGKRLGRKPSSLSVSRMFTWKNSSSVRGTSNFKYWATATAMFCIWVNVSAAFSDDTKNSSKSRHRWDSHPSGAPNWGVAWWMRSEKEV